MDYFRPQPPPELEFDTHRHSGRAPILTTPALPQIAAHRGYADPQKPGDRPIAILTFLERSNRTPFVPGKHSSRLPALPIRGKTLHPDLACLHRLPSSNLQKPRWISFRDHPEIIRTGTSVAFGDGGRVAAMEHHAAAGHMVAIAGILLAAAVNTLIKTGAVVYIKGFRMSWSVACLCWLPSQPERWDCFVPAALG